MEKQSRQLVKIVTEICAEHSIELKCFSYDWILQLSANNQVMFIFGYRFPNNNAAIERICSDKAALSDILLEHKIPHVHHYFFMAPNNIQYTGVKGDWDRMADLLTKYKKVVCKSNSGSGGTNVHKVDSQKSLEAAVFKIFSTSKSLCITPYVSIIAEYRIIVIDCEVGVIYQKNRPFVTGNGKATVRELVREDISLDEIEIDGEIEMDFIPKMGETVDISWKHNLGKGSVPTLIEDITLKEKLTDLALECSITLDINFGSIDIIESDEGFQILEINSGVMMETFAKSSSDNYLIAKQIYEKAIISYLGMNDLKYVYRIKRPVKTKFVLPILEEIANERNVGIIPDKEEGNFSIFVFNNGKRFVAKDYPFNINYAGSIGLCTNKAACSNFLHDMGFKTPKQKYFVKKPHIEVTINELKKVFLNPMEELGFEFPMIMKPNNLSQGIGVHRIHNIEEGLAAANQILSLKSKLFLLQEFCRGNDYRIVVLAGKVIQAYERVPFHVVGNGVNTIKELALEKSSQLAKGERDKSVDVADMRIEKTILRQGYTLNQVLKLDEVCWLQEIANLSLGGTTIELTSKISDFYSELAVEIASHLNLTLCGIDIMAQDITDSSNTDYMILEVNSAPGLDNYAYGKEKQERYVKQLYQMIFDYMEKM